MLMLIESDKMTLRRFDVGRSLQICGIHIGYANLETIEGPLLVTLAAARDPETYPVISSGARFRGFIPFLFLRLLTCIDF